MMVPLALFGAAALPVAAYLAGHPFRIRYEIPLVVGRRGCDRTCGGTAPRLGEAGRARRVSARVSAAAAIRSARADGCRSAARSRQQSQARARVTACLRQRLRRRHHHGEHGLARSLHARALGRRLRDPRFPARRQRADLGQRLHARAGAAGGMGAGRGTSGRRRRRDPASPRLRRGCSQDFDARVRRRQRRALSPSIAERRRASTQKRIPNVAT